MSRSTNHNLTTHATANNSASSSVSQAPARIDLLSIDFLSLGKYSPAAIEQVTKDWVRNQNIIFLNGAPLKEIVDNLKRQNLLQQLIHYRDTGPGKQDRLHALKLLYEAMNERFTKYIQDTKDSTDPTIIDKRDKILAVFENTFDDAEEVNFADNRMLGRAVPFLFVGLAGDDVLYDLRKIADKTTGTMAGKLANLAGHPPYASLGEVLRNAGKFFTAEERASDDVVISIWRNHLLQNVALEADKQAYIDQLAQFGHQGGFLFSSLTQHQEYVSYLRTEKGENSYTILGQDCATEATCEFSVRDNILHIVENTPIRRIFDGVAFEYIENSDRTPVMTTAVEHVISVKRDGTAELRIRSAVDNVTNQDAFDVVNRGFEEHKNMLLHYAISYLQNGHNEEKVSQIMARYPKIKDKVPVKMLSFVDWTLKSGQAMHHEGDRILVYVGMSFPKFADSIVAHISFYPKDDFVRAIKLLRRMGRSDLAVQAVLPYVLDIGAKSHHTIDMSTARQQAQAIVENQAEIEKAFIYLNKYGLLSASKSATPANQSKQERTDPRLFDYAASYLQGGHDKTKINELIAAYPDIDKMVPVKRISFIGHVRAQNAVHQKGDKILLYIGKYFPDYPRAVFSGIKQYDRQTYINAVKMLRRMGHIELAVNAVMPFLEFKAKYQSQTNVTPSALKEDALKIIEDQTMIAAAYDYMLEHQQLAASVSAAAMKNLGGKK